MDSPKFSFPNPELGCITACRHQLIWISNYIRSLRISANAKQLSWLCPTLLGVIFLSYVLSIQILPEGWNLLRISHLGECVLWENMLLGKGPSLHSGPTFIVCLTLASHLRLSEPPYLLLQDDSLLTASSVLVPGALLTPFPRSLLPSFPNHTPFFKPCLRP